jgi:hypothetical protein
MNNGKVIKGIQFGTYAVVSLFIAFVTFQYGRWRERVDNQALPYACGYRAGQEAILAAYGNNPEPEYKFCTLQRRNAIRLGFDPEAQGDK